jgi:hypothetical protein
MTSADCSARLRAAATDCECSSDSTPLPIGVGRNGRPVFSLLSNQYEENISVTTTQTVGLNVHKLSGFSLSTSVRGALVAEDKEPCECRKH